MSRTAPIRDEPMLAVVGPTASGKTAAALALARMFGGELIGADSVQVYRGFDIGSAKPTVEELAGIAHHLIDVADADAPIDAAQYAALADEAIAATIARGHVPIVVGGTGLWLRALLRGLVDLPPVDHALRAALEKEAMALGLGALHARLREVDPRAAKAIHANDRIRIIRALEVHSQTGHALGDLHHEHALGAPRYNTLTFVLADDAELVTERIIARTDTMLAAGFEDEVRALLARWGPDVRALQSVGYREMIARIQGNVSLDQTRTAIIRSTRIYARRQRTWWKNEPGVHAKLPAAALSAVAQLSEIRVHLRK
ncbi:MAG: tRNA (adenosine(37)-N6)-dimethylallyltransferase MiaA [Sandaracinaceae bacterium]|nr:tRNA (adenosine(37)-N6)-dimethylallyltransferase MiaA [Sandaracinaceae bacterium]